MPDFTLMREVAKSVTRVFSGLASAPLHVAHLADKLPLAIDQKAGAELFASGAIKNAELLEREARSIREAVERYHRQSTA